MLKESLLSFLYSGDSGEPTDHSAAEVGTRREIVASPERVELPAGARACAVAAGFGFGVIALQSGGAALASWNTGQPRHGHERGASRTRRPCVWAQ